MKSDPQRSHDNSRPLAGAAWFAALAMGLFLAACASSSRPAASTPGPSGISSDAGTPDIREPDVPPSLRVLPGNKASFHAYAIGAQIYVWTVNETNAAKSAWALRAPSAALFDEDGAFVGYHYKGPTWESRGGFSQVEGVVLQRSAPDSNAVPWLLLQGTNATGRGDFANITYIQRVNTTGGLAPNIPGTEVGERVRVPYTAEYFFYRAAK